MVFCFDGRYRSGIECKFLEQAEEELTKFWSSCRDNSVLVFPPLSARYRFLVHRLVGVGSRLHTVSVGQGRQRRTVVYFAPESETDKMAHSPSTSQSTFFGRGRSRRPRRPDQALYVPGALRKAKCDQLKQNSATESSIKITENKELSKSNDVTSTIFMPKDGQDCFKASTNGEHEAKTDVSSNQNIPSVSERAVDNITEETDSTSFDTNVQHTNMPLSLSVNERLQSKNKKPNRKDKAENDGHLVAAISEKSSKVLDNKSDDTPQTWVEKDEIFMKNKDSIIDDQSLHTAFKTEFSDRKNDCKRDVVVNSNISQPLLMTSTIGNDSVDETLSTPTDEKCDGLNEKLLFENTPVLKHDQDMVKSKTKCENVSTVLLVTENQSLEDDPLLKVSGNSVIGEQRVEIEEETETKEAADCSPVDIEREEKAEQGESWIENKVTLQSDSVDKESSEVLTCTESGVCDHKEEHENAVKHCEDVTASELACGQSDVLNKNIIEEAELRTSKVTLISVCENTVNYEKNPVVTLDIVSPTFSIDNENLEPENSMLGLGNSIDRIEEKIQAMAEKIEDVSGSKAAELNEVGGEVETEQQKASKKKKGKKDKSKELKESKEKGEKKKKKEKKIVRDKTDKEGNLNSEVQIKVEKKSKTKEQSTEEKVKKDLSACDIDKGKEVTTDNKYLGETCSKNSDDDIDDNDDDDNWESNFDESGDCLNPDYLEELSRLTGISNPEVHKTQYDYYSFTPKGLELDDEEFGHIVEIYNFAPELKTQDLMQALSAFRSKGFDIKWVDDTHALAVFASRHAAQDAITLCSGPLMRLRPVSEGTPESKKKAHHCFEFLQPYRERPQTCKLLADRLVTGALGMRSKMTREERVKEREKIKEAKSKRQQEKIQKAQIWGD